MFDSNTLLLLLEITLVFGVIWLIFKKNDSKPHIRLTKSEEDKIIENYKPEELAGPVPEGSFALKPMILYGKVGMYVNIDGVKCLNFGSHNYLGFVGNKDIEEEANKCIDIFGVGSCGPRGFYGTCMPHLELEGYLARLLESEDSIVYSYGFSTCASAIPAYAKSTDIIFADEKRHFAIQQGLNASKSKVIFFKHNDTEDLEKIMENVRLKDLENMRKARRIRRYLVVEGISINTGEICPLPELVRLCKTYKVRLFVDESVSFGVLGETGKGVTEYFGIPRADVDLIMGSLEYALGSVGGFCAGSRLLIDHQQISGQGYCFSASLPPLLARVAIAALRTIEENPEILVKLKNACKTMHFKLNCSSIINRHFDISGDQDSPLHLLFVKQEFDDHAANGGIDNFLEFCLHKNVAVTRAAYLTGVDPVNEHPSIRLTASVHNTQEHIDRLISVLEEACSNVFFDNCREV